MGSLLAAKAPASAASLSRIGWLPWVLGGAFIVAFAIRDLLLTHGLIIDNAVVWGRDFANVWTGGHLVHHGLVSKLYDVAAYQAYQRQLFGAIGQHSFSYPPVTFPISVGLAYLPYPMALAIWQVAGVAFFIWTARPWWPRRIGPLWLAVLTPAALVNLWAGQYGFFIGGLFLLGWRQVELGRSILAGICFGLMLIKPQLAVLVPLALALRGEWRTILSAALTVFVLVAASILAYGIQPWRDLLFGTGPFLAGLINARGSFFGFMSTSAATAAFSAGGSLSLALVTQAAFAAGGLYAVVASGLRKAPLREFALLVATATFVVLPYGFNYDMAVLMLGSLYVMVSADRSTMDWRLAFYGFIAPQLGMLLAAANVPLMPVMIAGLLYAQFRLITSLSRQQASTI
jgi:alpha-1,2-mannosyltransferase